MRNIFSLKVAEFLWIYKSNELLLPSLYLFSINFFFIITSLEVRTGTYEDFISEPTLNDKIFPSNFQLHPQCRQ